MRIEKQLHLEKDLKISKLTLRRWLREHCSHAGGSRRWAHAAALLGRWSRRYTVKEVRALLQLGLRPYRGFKGMRQTVKAGLHDNLVRERKNIVARVEKRLQKYV